MALTQEELSYLADVSSDTVKRVEGGRPTSVLKLVQILLALKMPTITIDSPSEREPQFIKEEILRLIDML